MDEFKIGDEVWYAWSAPRQVRETCPVCAGNRSVTVLLGSGTPVIVDCDYCGKGFEGPQGSVLEYQYGPAARRARIREIRAEETASGRRAEYGLEDGYWGGAGTRLFRDETSARAAAAVMAEADAAHEAERIRHRRKNAIQSPTWRVGYHLREAKRLREEAARHEAHARVVKQKAAP